MNDPRMRTLGEVLERAETLDWRHALYLPFSEGWTAATACAVLDSGEPDEPPPFAQQYGLQYALGISAVQDIVVNARSQRPTIDTDGLLKALLFYYDHDGFMVFSEQS